MYGNDHFRSFSNIVLLLFSLTLLLQVTVGNCKQSTQFVTCGSSLKLKNTYSRVCLHSHDVKYGSGSGQQSVTAIDDTSDHNSYWQVLGRDLTQSPTHKNVKPGDLFCERGQPIKCNSVIRLLHMTTGKLLHSHGQYRSPLSHGQEVSAYGKNGVGDSSDNWKVECANKEAKYWERSSDVKFKHVATGKYLHVPGDTYGRPIHGQKEVTAHYSSSAQSLWRASEGIFILSTNKDDLKIGKKDKLNDDQDDDVDD
ncbi:hypothetical protein SNEBB_007888 [Seison nebaliae]|nr:hypothetical protein SNEBB_007888 [Seison nebaliae]